MEMTIVVQGKDDPPALERYITQPFIDLMANQSMVSCVVEGMMASGEPGVILLSTDKEGTVAFATSLDKFLSAASGMAAAAESRWGWARPEGHVTIMPPSREARKAMLEQINKELQEWEDADVEVSDG